MPEARLCRTALSGEADDAEQTDDDRVAVEANGCGEELLARLQALHGDRPPRPERCGQELSALAATG